MKISYLKISSMAILVIVTFAMLFSCSDEIPTINRINSKEERPTLTIVNLKSSFTEEGRLKGKLQAPLAEQHDGIVERYMDFPNGIIIVLFNKENEIETSATANRAIYYQTKESWEAIGNVVVTNISGDILRTEKLYGDQKEDKLFTDQPVEITKADGTVIHGEVGFESNTEFTAYNFYDVSGKIIYRDEFTTSDEQAEPTKKPNAENKPKTFKPKKKDRPN